jgi:hypothetical protein
VLSHCHYLQIDNMKQTQISLYPIRQQVPLSYRQLYEVLVSLGASFLTSQVLQLVKARGLQVTVKVSTRSPQLFDT